MKKTKIGFSSILTQDVGMPNAQSHVAPLHLSSTFVYPSPDEAVRIISGKKKGFIYNRWSHPNAELAESKLEQLEILGSKLKAKSLLFSNGMSAIAALFQAVLKPGDAVLCQGNVYGTTVDYFNHYSTAWKVQVIYADLKQHDDLERIFCTHKNIKLLYCESPSNPTVNCYDLKKLAAIAHKHGALMAVDNTFASPYLQQPLLYDCDFVLHSATKYLNGHGTALGGVLTGSNLAFMENNVWKIRKLNGSICPPMDAWLLNLGMKTLALRMERHCQSAMDVAQRLEKHKAVKKVNYLGLKSHPDHSIAKRQMKKFGGVLSFELKGGYKSGKRMMERIKFCTLTASLGATDTLIQHPASMSHCFVPKTQREQYGITDGLIRLSVGLEEPDDIFNDLEQAMK